MPAFRDNALFHVATCIHSLRKKDSKRIRADGNTQIHSADVGVARSDAELLIYFENAHLVKMEQTIALVETQHKALEHQDRLMYLQSETCSIEPKMRMYALTLTAA